ncbi:MAG: peptide deformylase [Erysipelotrichaceae bacterium]|nr:peptide deformylase [Erysipelotrichaceae bacterium]MDD3810318.1 peptide deformylase [Erysipelotrichaceae bacterium]
MILMKDIIDDNDVRIREVSKEVTLPLSEQDATMLKDMHQFLVNSQDEQISEKYQLRPAVGIAAIQLGVPKRMCAIHILDWDEDGNVISSTDYALVNPKVVAYTPKKSYLKDGEGCLSVNDPHEGYVPRHAKITVEAYDLLSDKNIKITARGFEAICIQHEMDHFDGILFYDRINKQAPLKPIENAIIL